MRSIGKIAGLTHDHIMRSSDRLLVAGASQPKTRTPHQAAAPTRSMPCWQRLTQSQDCSVRCRQDMQTTTQQYAYRHALRTKGPQRAPPPHHGRDRCQGVAAHGRVAADVVQRLKVDPRVGHHQRARLPHQRGLRGSKSLI